MERSEIETIIPHRYPFLLIDRIVELKPGRRAIGLKLVTENDQYMQALPGYRPSMPGVLILEALAQVGAVALLSSPLYYGKVTLLTGINGAHFYYEVFPGDELRLEAEITRIKGKMGKRKCQALVGKNIVAEAELLFFLIDKTT